MFPAKLSYSSNEEQGDVHSSRTSSCDGEKRCLEINLNTFPHIERNMHTWILINGFPLIWIITIVIKNVGPARLNCVIDTPSTPDSYGYNPQKKSMEGMMTSEDETNP